MSMFETAGEDKAEQQAPGDGADVAKRQKLDDDIDGEPMDGDIDGEPMTDFPGLASYADAEEAD